MCNSIKFISGLILLIFLTVAFSASASETFPKRKYYPQLNYIDTQEFAQGIKEKRFDVIDVRDKTSFQALHVKTASNIFVKSNTFEQDILEFSAKSNKPLVIYCNGISCSKSYVASTKILDLFLQKDMTKQVFTYDSGINAIAYAHNELVLKNGKDVSQSNPLIAIEKIKKHTLTPLDFETYLSNHENKDYALLDIRDKNEKIILKLFMFQKEKNIVLAQRNKLIKFLNKIKQDKKTLLVYDASGRQINGLYELLNITGVKQWHYLEGGEYGYSQYVIKAAGL
jgi:rhodanese-related sulfurtransferase